MEVNTNIHIRILRQNFHNERLDHLQDSPPRELRPDTDIKETLNSSMNSEIGLGDRSVFRFSKQLTVRQAHSNKSVTD